MALLALFVSPALADRSIAGSYVNIVAPAGPLVPSTDYDFDFYVYNGSVDTEWIADIVITFPACWEITGGGSYSNPAWSFSFSGIGTNVATWADGDAGYGEIYDG